jgi:hypothetical protein
LAPCLVLQIAAPVAVAAVVLPIVDNQTAAVAVEMVELVQVTVVQEVELQATMLLGTVLLVIMEMLMALQVAVEVVLEANEIFLDKVELAELASVDK